MVRVYSSAGLQEAYIVLAVLEQSGISARVLNANAQGGLGEIPFTQTYPEIWVDDPDEACRARDLIASFHSAPRDSGSRTCSECREASPGNFGTCWNCGAALP